MEYFPENIIGSNALKSIQRMEETVMKLAAPCSEMQNRIQEMMKTSSPLLEALAKQSEIAMKALDLPRMEPFYKEMARMADWTNQFSGMLATKIDISFLRASDIPRLHIPYEFPDVVEEIIESPIISLKKTFIEYDKINDEFLVAGEKIDFPDANALYVVVLKALFALSANNKICSFEKIDKFLEDSGIKHIRSKKGKIQRIHNAIGHLLRKRSDGSVNFPSYTPDGKAVIKNVRRQGFVLNNPQI